MSLRLYDTMSRKKRPFAPHDPRRVTMYVCGPTVYNFSHIGNFRPVVVFDVLFRLLRRLYGEDAVLYAANVTDVDDKINAKAAEEGVAIDVITDRYLSAYNGDMAALGALAPTFQPRATETMDAIVAMIGRLVDGGSAYAAEGHVLFDTTSYAGYGELSGRALDDMIAGARVEVAPYKRNPADFVLWKPSTPAQPGWESPWGRGRPGWHIECSAMIAAELGETIDIHGGGLDLIFPHHENELAQSACAHGAPLARVWLHNGFLSMGGGDKMSKSLGNVVGVDDLLAAGWSGEVIRLALLSAHYRQPLVWSDELLARSKATLDRWQGFLRRSQEGATAIDPEALAAMQDDLNTPQAVATIPRIIRDGDIGTLRATVTFLGLDEPIGAVAHIREADDAVVVDAQVIELPLIESVRSLVAARTAARARKDFAESDRIRDELAGQGVILEDGANGTTWRRS